MSAQPDSEIAAALQWPECVNAVVNGTYPLQQLLSVSDHSAVFLTECPGRTDPKAAVKLIPIEQIKLAQLDYWKAAIGSSHPHLVQLLDTGLCQLSGHRFLFVVMEFAEQSLAEVLSQRPLTPDEVRELLPPTLDALTFLHGRGLVHGHLKPSNFLVVNDQLKLSSDGIRPIGAPRDTLAAPSSYDPPEANRASFASAGDVWSLGITLIEAMTQDLPRFDEQPITASLPATVAPALAYTVKRCLRANPIARVSVADLKAELNGVPNAQAIPVLQPAVSQAPQDIATTPDSGKSRLLLPGIAAIAGVFLLVAIGTGWHSRTRPDPGAVQPQAIVPAVPAPKPAMPVPVARPAVAASSVIHTQLPNIPRRSLETIRGHFIIVESVTVDQSGAVIGESPKQPGPSAYFSRLTREAAKRWTFTTTTAPGTREWLLRFDFTHSGVVATATRP